MSLLQQIEDRSAHIGIIGLGYVGLPLVHAFAQAGFQVTGFDTDPDKISLLASGNSYIAHIPDQSIRDLISEKRFLPTHNFDAIQQLNVVVICVPTPLQETREPDLSYVRNTATCLAGHLQRGQLVVLESTTYPGTTEHVVKPLLESSGLKAGTDFYLAYSPEREDPGNAQRSAALIPKVIGGMDSISGDLATELYRQVVVDVVRVSNTMVAEACKILENTYRAVNIAMVNELKVLFTHMGIDIWEVIDAAKTKPFGFQAFYPGPGLGGHCIPIDPFYLAWLAKQQGLTTKFIELAGEINTAMPQYVIQRVTDALHERNKALIGSKILVLGVAYKKDVDDPRESPSFPIIETLISRGAHVTYNDPHIARLPQMRNYQIRMESQPLTVDSVHAQDCVLLLTDHSDYELSWILEHCQLLVDTRGATRRIDAYRDRIVSA